MAKAAGVSEAHLFKLFKTHYGLTPAAFANRRKILKAAEMLLSSNAKLYEISEELGFANPYHLSRVFKDYFKASPRSYKSDNELFKYKNID